jgi:peptidylprolyl isomerase
MPRHYLTAALACAALTIAGCGGDSGGSAGGTFGQQPQITIPNPVPTSLTVTTPITGKGPKIGKTDFVIAHVVAKVVRGGTEFFNSFKNGTPVGFPMGSGQLLPGWETGLDSKTEGSRVVILTPPADAFGEQGNPDLKITKDDSVIASFDILSVFTADASADGTPVAPVAGLPTVTAEAGKKPKITFPANYKPSGKLVVQPLLQGSGETIVSGDTLVAQYVGVIAPGGKQFDASWDRKQVASFPIGVSQVIPGWDKGLVGTKIGSRVLLVIPPADGYGKSGNAQAGIKGTDTLVFVVDVLGRIPAPKPTTTATTDTSTAATSTTP